MRAFIQWVWLALIGRESDGYFNDIAEHGPITPLKPEEVKQVEQSVDKEGYLHRVAVGADIFADEIAGGPMDETISSREARAALKGKWWGIAISSFLNLFEKDHGAKAIAGDDERAKTDEKIEKDSGVL